MSIWCDCLRLKDILSITIKIRSRIQTANNQNNIISMPAIHELNCIHANACHSIWICNLKPRHTRAHTYKHFNVIGEFLYSPSHSFGYVLCAKLHFNISFIIASIPSVIIFHNYELKGFIIHLFRIDDILIRRNEEEKTGRKRDKYIRIQTESGRSCSIRKRQQNENRKKRRSYIINEYVGNRKNAREWKSAHTNEYSYASANVNVAKALGQFNIMTYSHSLIGLTNGSAK